MSINHNPATVTSGLVLCYDMANTLKSWKGAPTTNQFSLPTGATNGFGVQNSTFTRVYTGTYGNCDIQSSDYVWLYNINGSDCPYHGWDIPTTAGTVVTFSFDYYVSPSTVGYPSTNYLANIENNGIGASGSVSDPTPSIIGVWKRAYFSVTATATGNSRCLLYPGSCGGQLASGTGFILYKNPQVEFNTAGAAPTPFVVGTRSNTQALLDLTGNTTFTANNLSYAANGTFSFNGSSRLNFTMSGSASQVEYTRIVWVTPTASDGDMKSVMLNSVGNNADMAIGIANNRASFHQYTNANGAGNNLDLTISGTTVIPLNQPCMIAVTVDRSLTTNNVKIYLNGVLDGTGSANLGNSSSDSVIIGGPASDSYSGARMFYGNIYAASQYNRILSAAEVAQNFNALRGRYGL